MLTMYPTDRQYSKEHEWVLVADDAATVGITHYAQDQLGDIVYVEIPETGKQVEKGEVIGSIESVKAVSEIYAPFAGSVIEVNDALDQAPETINSDPHGEGWYCKIKVANRSELEELMDAAAYQEFVEAAG
jgi:glycine cleavage system H protein